MKLLSSERIKISFFCLFLLSIVGLAYIIFVYLSALWQNKTFAMMATIISCGGQVLLNQLLLDAISKKEKITFVIGSFLSVLFLILFLYISTDIGETLSKTNNGYFNTFLIFIISKIVFEFVTIVLNYEKSSNLLLPDSNNTLSVVHFD